MLGRIILFVCLLTPLSLALPAPQPTQNHLEKRAPFFSFFQSGSSTPGFKIKLSPGNSGETKFTIGRSGGSRTSSSHRSGNSGFNFDLESLAKQFGFDLGSFEGWRSSTKSLRSSRTTKTGKSKSRPLTSSSAESSSNSGAGASSSSSSGRSRSTTGISETSSGDGVSGDMNKCLRIHNEKRATDRNVIAPPLVWDKELATAAEQYAQNMADSGSFNHDSNRGDVGENLYMSTGTAGCQVASEAWYNEVDNYSPGSPVGGFSIGAVGHYTQMMWKSTKKLGCGAASGRGGTYVVCRYFPAGNIVGTSIENS